MADADKRIDLVARGRALRALAVRHPDEFDDLLDVERRELGLPPVARRQPLDIERVAELYRAGRSPTALAAELGVSRETVRKALIDADIERRRGRRVAIPA